MTTTQTAIPEQIRQRAEETVRQALEDAHFDRDLVSRSFNRQLAALQLPPRPVIFYPNLRAAVKRVCELVKVAWDAARDIARDAPWDAAWDAATATAKTAARAAARNAASNAASDAPRDSAWVTAMTAAWRAVKDAPWAVATDAVQEAARGAARGAAWDAARGAAWRAVRDTPWAKAWHAVWDEARDATRDAVWAVALSGAPSSDDHPSIITARSFLEIVRGGAFFFWIAPDAVHVVLAQIHSQKTPRVVETHRIRQTMAWLHREDGPAIQYEDGSGLYFWKGIQVPERVILRPDVMRVQDIMGERNAEVRRAMIERYGQDRFVLDAGAEVLNEWKGNELLSIDLPEDPDLRLVALKLRCPSTAAVYILRVPPDQTIVQGALAWSFGLDVPEQYVLQKES